MKKTLNVTDVDREWCASRWQAIGHCLLDIFEQRHTRSPFNAMVAPFCGY
jgi:hypothetical protein